MSAQHITSSGVSLPRSQPPVINSNFLSRKHLFPLFESGVPGATLVVAPAGFGKTSLVSEWVQANERPTVWYTVDAEDTIKDFQAHVIASIESYFPNFFSGVEQIEHFDPVDAIKGLGLAISQLSGEFNLVVDNGQTDNYEIAQYAQLIADSIPNNCHMVIIRRSTPLTSLARFAALGNLSVITSNELKFSNKEVEVVAGINNVDLTGKSNLKELTLCNGWPAAVQLMCRNITKGNSHTTFTEAVSSNINPIGILALETYKTFSEASQEKILRLSITEEFDTEMATIILEEDYSEDFLNRLAADGLFFSISNSKQRFYRFNPIIFEALSQIPQVSEDKTKEVQRKLGELYISRGQLSKALNFIFHSGDRERFTEIFRASIRQMAAIGRGDLLIRWSNFAADDSPQGEIMRKTIKVVGHLAMSDFHNAEALASELEYIASISPDGTLLHQLSAMVKANIYFARGDFARSAHSLDIALAPNENMGSLDSTDIMSLLRLRARRAFIYDEFDVLNQAHTQAQLLPTDGDQSLLAYQLSCIQSMVFYAEGQYFNAAEISTIAIAQASENGYAGINGPLDAMMVLARCQLEASNLEECLETLSKLMELAKEWDIWPWFFMAEGTIIRIRISQGSLAASSELILNQRKFLSTLQTPNQLSWVIDMSEIFLRLMTKDWTRADELINRMPPIELVRQIQGNIELTRNPKKVAAKIAELPENTVREKINKWLSEVSINLDNEKLALKSLGKALDLGAENGYFEYFIRQTAMYSLIVKGASAKPTIYMEGLVQAMTQRLQTMNSNSGEIDEKLTQRELEILKHLTTGNPISAIAKTLHISQNTMKTHLRNTYRKLDADGRHTAVEKAKKLLLI
jgi:LuxR family maltose regulon positive regulatory protein